MAHFTQTEDIFAEQKRQYNERKRREEAKSQNSILKRFIRVDVDPELITITCKSQDLRWRDDPPPDPDDEDQELFLHDLHPIAIPRIDDRSSYGFSLKNAMETSIYLDRITSNWIRKSIPFSMYIKLKNGLVAENHYIITTNCLDWLFWHDVYEAEEVEKNETIPATLGRIDHDVYQPSMDDIQSDWVQYLSTMDIYMESQKYIMIQPAKPVSVHVGSHVILQRVKVVKTMIGMGPAISKIFREAGFEYSHQNSQWQSIDPNTQALEPLFTPIEYTPIEVLGFLPEFRAKKVEAPRTIRFSLGLWPTILGSTNVIGR